MRTNKEILAVVNQMVSDGQITQEVVEKYFPELRESKDERMMRIIMNALIKVPYSELDGLIPDTIRIWLEGKIKQGEQKPAWSEEVEAAISLLKHIAEEQEKDYCPTNAHDLRKAAHYLETCRPQSQWKPSKEQMVALDGICSYIRNKADWEISQDIVSDLYKLSEQLKKLKE